MVVIYSIVLTLFPGLFFVVILLIMFTFLGYSIFTSYKRIRASRSGEDVDYIKSGRVIVKANPSKIIDFINKDEKLIDDMKPQMKMMSVSLINLPIVFGIYYLYLGYVIHYFALNGTTYLFIGYLILFEILFLLPWILNRVIMSGREIEIIQLLRDYIVTTKGVLASGFLLKFPFNTSDYKIICNKKRRFIDIKTKPQIQALTNMRSVTVYRMYMSEQDLQRVIEIMSKTNNISLQCE